MCTYLQIPMQKSLGQIFHYTGDIDSSDTALYCILRRLSSKTEVDLIKVLGVNPTLSAVLRKIGTKSAFLFGWLSSFLSVSDLPTLKNQYETYLQSIEAVLADPIVAYINAAHHVEEYRSLEKHDDLILAEHAACTISQAQEALLTLKKFEMITYDGKKFHPSSFDFSFSGLIDPKLRGLTKHTTCLAAERYPAIPVASSTFNKPHNASRSSVRVKALSAQSAIKLSELISKFHSQVDDIIKEDHGPKTNVQIVLVHSFASTINSPFSSENKNN